MKIVIVGSINTDMIVKVPRIPKPGETILGGKFSTAAGGKGANQAVAATRAGGNVTFIARVGNDMFGKQALEDFESNNINAKYIKTDNAEPSGVALIFVDEKGENSIAVASGANARLSHRDVTEAEEVIKSADILTKSILPLPEKFIDAVGNSHGISQKSSKDSQRSRSEGHLKSCASLPT